MASSPKRFEKSIIANEPTVHLIHKTYSRDVENDAMNQELFAIQFQQIEPYAPTRQMSWAYPPLEETYPHDPRFRSRHNELHLVSEGTDEMIVRVWIASVETSKNRGLAMPSCETTFNTSHFHPSEPRVQNIGIDVFVTRDKQPSSSTHRHDIVHLEVRFYICWDSWQIRLRKRHWNAINQRISKHETMNGTFHLSLSSMFSKTWDAAEGIYRVEFSSPLTKLLE